MVGAHYLLLYTKDQTETNLFFKLKRNNAKIYTKSELKNNLEYPTSPSQETYLIYTLEPECEVEFSNLKIDLRKIKDLGKNKKPRAYSLVELLGG